MRELFSRKGPILLIISFTILISISCGAGTVSAEDKEVNVISSFNAPGGGPGGLAWDGDYLWNRCSKWLDD